MISVEPETCPTLHNAMQAGQPVDVAVDGVAADSLGARQVGALMFPIAQRFISRTVLVSDEHIVNAQRLIWDQYRLVAEPGGAAAVAGVVSRRFIPPKDSRIGIVICGGNTNPATLAG